MLRQKRIEVTGTGADAAATGVTGCAAIKCMLGELVDRGLQLAGQLVDFELQ